MAKILLTPRVRGMVGGALVLLGLTGALSATLAGSAPVQAGGTCQANTAYALPQPVALSAAAGLQIQDDGVATYGVGGKSAEMIRGALNDCAPTFNGTSKTGEFLAYTSYAVTWRYAVTQSGPDTCQLTDVAVGLHLSQLLPSLTSADTDTAVRAKWQSFSRGLKTHEDGHKSLDITQAQRLLGDLQSLHGHCDTIEASAHAVISQSLQDFVTVNADHDTATDFGRDQGANW